MISDYLSKRERLDAMRYGARAYAGYLDAADVMRDGSVKSAGVDLGTAGNALLLSSIVAGVPLGVFTHIMGKRISGRRLKEEELKKKIEMYQAASDEMASGLSDGGSY